MIFKDSLGITHHVHEPLLKAGVPAPAEPPPGAFRALIDDLAALRDRMAAKPAPARRPAKPLRKSLADLARDAQRMAAQVQRRTEEIQRRTARALIDDLSAQARAGKLDAISAAKLDALAHRHARALGLESTGVRS